MLSTPNIHDLLATVQGEAVDHALLTALPTVDGAGQQRIADALLARGMPAGLRGLIENFHILDESLRNRVLEQPEGRFRVLRESFQSREDQVRINVMEIIRRGRMYRAAYLLDTGLHDRSPLIRRAAAETLCTLAERLLEDQPTCIPDERLGDLSPEQVHSYMRHLVAQREDRRQLVAAIEAGLHCFNLHLHPKVVEAAMWFIEDMGSSFWQILTAPASRTLHVATSILQEPLAPRLAAFAMNAMAYSEFRPHVVNALATCKDPSFLTAWLRQSWQLGQHRVARGMAAIKELACADEHGKVLMQLPADALRHAACWINATGIPEDQKLLLLRELRQQDDPEVRRSAVWGLTRCADDRALLPLRGIAVSGDPELAPMARLQMARRRPASFTLSDLLKLAMGQAVDISQAGRIPEPQTLEEYWTQFDEMPEEARRQIGRELYARTPRARGVICKWLADPDTGTRVKALRMITALNLAAELSEQLYQLSHASEPEVRSAAVMALGQLPNPTSKRILRNALSDQDRRVQANAVEAFDTATDEQAAETLLPLLASPDNRVRANAVKALLKLGVRQAAETLLRMLNDSNRAQRVSALWLVDHMGLVTLASRIVNMARSDADAQVRVRARLLADRLNPADSEPAGREQKESVPLPG